MDIYNKSNSVDGLLIKINDDFIKNLYQRGLSVSYIRVRFLIRDFQDSITRKGYRFMTFNTLESFNSYFSSILNSKNYLCSAGDFPVLENIEINNNNVSFLNSYKWYNVTEDRKFVRKIKYDSFRNEKYIAEAEKYENLLNVLFDRYITDINRSIDIRLNSYMDPCYVDAGYVSPYSGLGDYIKFKNSTANQI